MRTSPNVVRTLIAVAALVAALLPAAATEPAAAVVAPVAVPADLRVDGSAKPAAGALKLVWSGVPGARTYRATATPASGGAPVSVQTSSTFTALFGLATDTTYDLTVQASDGSTWSATSPAVRATTLGPGDLPTFSDVPRSSTFAWETTWLASHRITTGYDDGTFRPSQPVLREQMAAFLHRLAGSPPVADLPTVSPYTDVPTSSRFYPEIVWLSSTGITTGYDDGTFRPSQPVLREQMAAFLHRFGPTGDGSASTLTSEGPSFVDVPSSHVFAGEVRWLASAGITTGYDDDTFRPAQPVLREQMAAFLYRHRLIDTAIWADEPEPAAPAEPGAPSCGTTIRKHDGTAWTCTFADDFDGTALDRSKWLAMETATSGYAINGDCYVDSPQNIAVGDGTLTLTARAVSPMTCESPHGAYVSQHTAASISTWGLFAQTYGRFEIRARMPAASVAGTHSAWWLYPQKPGTYGAFPYSGEIDIAEFYSAWPDRVIPMLHYGPSDGGAARTNHHCMIDDPTQFHTYTAEWTAVGITIFYDGQLCLSHRWEKVEGMPLGAPFDQDYTLTLTQGVGATGNLATAATPFPATMEVDYVRVWA